MTPTMRLRAEWYGHTSFTRTPINKLQQLLIKEEAIVAPLSKKKEHMRAPHQLRPGRVRRSRKPDHHTHMHLEAQFLSQKIYHTGVFIT